MTHDDVARALALLAPGAAWVLNADELTWLDQNIARPTDDAIASAAAALPPLPEYVAASAMLGRLTDAEYVNIMQGAAAQLAAGSGQLSRWLDMARTATPGVNLNDAATIAAKAGLVSAGLLTGPRADAVFAPT